MAMDILSFEFLSALAAIIVIDLVLAGDNAIVIALAARSLPPALRKQAVVWGTAAAIGTRAAMTLAVVWLLKIPGLLLAGGLLLIWIAYRLLVPENGGHASGTVKAGQGFWGAIRTIVVADVVMGLDNVLAVAGAAKGSYLLVVLGLLISVPIMVWGSTLVLRWIERWPVIVYLGAAVLAWTAAAMIVGEPAVAALLRDNPAADALIRLLVVGGVLWAGLRVNHLRIQSSIDSRLAALTGASADQPVPVAVVNEGGRSMSKVLVPVDGSPNSAVALRRVIALHDKSPDLEVHLLNVQPFLSRHVAQFLGRQSREAYHRDQAEQALGPARKMLALAGVPHHAHVRVGARADAIAVEANKLGCDRIVMRTARKNSFTRMIEDSTTNQVLEKSSVPVEVISGRSISAFERFGLPAGLSATIALAIAAALD